RSMVSDSITIQPAVDKTLFSKKLGYQSDCLEMRIKNLHLTSDSFIDLVLLQNLVLDKVDIGELEMHDYRDKNIPRKHATRLLPYTFLHSIGTQIDIHEIRLQDGNITYEELAPNAAKSGSVSFSKVQGTLTNLNNMRTGDTMTLKG